jgi:hypothetical protein
MLRSASLEAGRRDMSMQRCHVSWTRVKRRGLSLSAGVALGAALGFGAATASAHAPPLGARVLSPAVGAGTDEVIVTNRGLVFRDRESGASRLLCNEALRINTAELPNVALLADGGLLVATSSGLRLSRDQGCSWSDVGQMETTNTPALAADPSDPRRVFVANYDSDVPGLRETRDAGASWTLAYTTADEDYIHSILIAAEDPSRVYATLATYGQSGPPTHSLLRSRDGGVTWERSALPLNEKDYLATAAAVSPEDPDTLILYTVANSPGLDSARLLVSHDAGDTFEVALERPEIRGAGYGLGGKLWVAARDGLYGADDALGVFTLTSNASELGCVGERAGALFVCGHYAGAASAESGIGISADGGQSFEPWLDFAGVDTPVECSAESLTTSLCARPWLDWELEMLGGVPTRPGGYGPVGPGGATLTPSTTPTSPGVASPDSSSPGAGVDMGLGAAPSSGAAEAGAAGCGLSREGTRYASNLAVFVLGACAIRARRAHRSGAGAASPGSSR